MTEFSEQGELDVLGTIVYASPNNIKSKVKAIRLNNQLAYTVIFERFDYELSTTSIIYTLELAAGDTINDTFEYNLKDNDYLILTSDIVGTTFLIIGEQYN